MVWVMETTAVPSWPKVCALCDADNPESDARAYGEDLKGISPVGYVFDVASVRVPACAPCVRRLRALTRAGVALLVVPWLILTGLSLVPAVAGSVAPVTMVLIAGIINGIGGAALLYRYWYSRAVRLRMLGDKGVRFAMRQAKFAKLVAEICGVDLRRSWLPVNW